MPLPTSETTTASRRAVLGGICAAAIAALPGCAGYPQFSLVDAVRRLMEISADRAFTRLLAPGGFWDDQLARLALPEALGRRGGTIERILAGPVFKDRLHRAFNRMAEDAAYNAAPAVTEAVRTIGIRNALELVRGGPSAASAFLRQEMGGRLVEIMVPAFGDALRVAEDPLIGQLLSALSGVDVGGIARSLASEADDAIWGAIGREEAAIRADPRSTNDPALIAVFGLAG